VLLSDGAGRILRANAAFRAMLGYAEGELEGRNREDLLSSGGAPQAPEWEYRRQDGRPLRVLALTWPARDRAGRVLGLLEMVQPLEPEAPPETPFLRTLVDTIPCPLFYKDAEGRYLGCNTAFEAYLGKPREQIIGATAYDVAPRELAEHYHQQDLALFHSPGIQNYEAQAEYADGTRHEVAFYKAAFLDAKGEAAGLVGVMLDISARKLAEQRLRDALEMSQKLLRAAPIGVAVFRASTGRCVAANAALARIVGCSIEQLLQQNFRELESWKRSGLLEAAELAILLGEEQHLEVQVTSSFGRQYWISTIFTSFLSGDEAHLLLIQEDISEQKAARDALQQSEARYRTLADKLGEGVAMADSSYRYTYCNPRLLQILGREADEVLGRSLTDFVVQKDREALLEQQAEHRRGRPLAITETQLSRKDGSVVDVLLSVSHLSSESGEFLGSLELITDITQMRMFENALREAQLTIIQHEKMAALGTMVAGVAHEINNPTHFMHLGAKSLENGLARFKRELVELLADDDPESLAYLERHFTAFEASLRRILEGCARVRTIVQDLRLFSRLGESGRREVPLAKGLELALRLVEAKHPAIHFVQEFKGPGQLLCTPSQVNQAFLNILDNACRGIEDRAKLAGAEFQGTLTASLLEDDTGVYVTIADNGCGMSASVKAKVFEPFFTTRPVGQGAGLGLAVAFQVIEDHRGWIEIESRPDEGTAVRVFLPFHP